MISIKTIENMTVVDVNFELSYVFSTSEDWAISNH